MKDSVKQQHIFKLDLSLAKTTSQEFEVSEAQNIDISNNESV